MSTNMVMEVEYQTLAPVSELDRLIFSSNDPFALTPAEERQVRVSVVQEAIGQYAERDPRYRRMLEVAAIIPDDLCEEDQLDYVPQIPTSVFKLDVLDRGDPDDVMGCRSSGTRGSISTVWRDSLTIQRLMGSVRAGIGLIENWFEDEVHILNLGPSRAEAGDLWFAYVMSLTELVYPTTHCVVNGVLDCQQALETLQELLLTEPNVGLVGPPALMAELAETAISQRTAINGEKLMVMTAGGWKRASGRALDRTDFESLVMSAFSLRSPQAIRDAFNQVELNTVLFECEAKRKHIPPWLHVTVRDPRYLRPVGKDNYGLLSYLDASAVSFPAFIITDDIGILRDGRCECGRTGRTMDILRRVYRHESWGCAIKMDRDVVR